MRFLKYFTVLGLYAVVATIAADDVIDTPLAAVAATAPVCAEVDAEIPLDTQYGAAGFMKNLAESPDSIRAIAEKLLQSALSKERVRPASTCKSNCTNGEIDEVIYRVAPVSFLPDEKQNAVCVAFEDQTRDTPLLFESRNFSSISDLNDWIMAFSQGRGIDGKLLYDRCSSNCSPRYTFLIAAQNEGYDIKAEVLCGLARDKSNDQYLISTALRRICAVN